jgi:REP-associated tyrosine transposase
LQRCRESRVWPFPTVPHHITQRGNGHRTIFYNDADHLVYLDLLARYAEEHQMSVWAYCLMSNHIHLIAVPLRPDSLARALGRIHADYARHRNVIDRSCGHVWQARFFSCPLDHEHLWRAMANIERNPVRAGLVRAAEGYRWSSARAHLGWSRRESFLELGEWRAWYNSWRWREALLNGVDEEAFQARLRDASVRGRALGSEVFVDRLEQKMGRKLRPNRAGRPKKVTAQIGK